MVKVKQAKKIVNGVLAYGTVTSSVDKKEPYVVVKVIRYLCNCHDFTFRGHECKHIKAFKAKEKK